MRGRRSYRSGRRRKPWEGFDRPGGNDPPPLPGGGRLPTEQDINVFDSLDERAAVKNFLGKTPDQAEALFRENFLHYGEDLMWMGPRAFGFYVHAAIAYLVSADADHDSSGVFGFCTCLESRLEHEPEAIEPIRSILCDGIRGILENFERYDCEEWGYFGDVAGRYRALLTKLES